MIIHINGPVASGKSTIAKELKKRYKSSIVVMDLDNLLNKFVKSKKKFTVKGYQKYINDFIKKNNKKPIIFVGIPQDMGRSRNIYDLSADHKLFIDLNVKENAKRRFIRDYPTEVDRFFMWNYDGSKPSAENIYEMWTKNEKLSTKRLQDIIKEISPAGMEKDTRRFRKEYKKMGFKFMKPAMLLKFVHKLLDK